MVDTRFDDPVAYAGYESAKAEPMRLGRKVRALYAPWFLLAVVGIGCQCADKCTRSCDTTPCDHPCPPPAPPCNESHATLPPAAQPCPAPEVQFQTPETIHVKAPAQKVVIQAAPEQMVAPQAPMMQAYSAAPAPMMQAYSAAPAPMMQAYSTAPAATAFSAVGPAEVQSVPANRARLAIGLDTIRIPIPFPRFFAVPTTEEMTVRVQQQSVVQSQAFAAPVQQAFYQTQAFAPPVQANSFALQAQAAPPQLVPVQSAQMVQMQAQPAQLVPVQSAPAPVAVARPKRPPPAQLVPVQSQSAQPVTLCPPCPPCPPCASQAATQQKLDECNRELETLKALIKERYPAKPAP